MFLDVDPKVDYAFKHLFGRESTRPPQNSPLMSARAKARIGGNLLKLTAT
jgi:hypothetical protein